jgi:hypothetical protein
MNDSAAQISQLLAALCAINSPMHLEFEGNNFRKNFKHSFSPPASESAVVLELLGGLCVDNDELMSLYKEANGMHLFFSRTNNVRSGEYFIPSVRIYPFQKLAAQTAYMQAAADEEEESNEERPAYSGGLVFGEAVGTGNCFVLMRRGPLAGKVMNVDHDPDVYEWHINPFAESLTHFLEKFSHPPYIGLCHLCGADRIWFDRESQGLRSTLEAKGKS